MVMLLTKSRILVGRHPRQTAGGGRADSMSCWRKVEAPSRFWLLLCGFHQSGINHWPTKGEPNISFIQDFKCSRYSSKHNRSFCIYFLLLANRCLFTRLTFIWSDVSGHLLALVCVDVVYQSVNGRNKMKRSMRLIMKRSLSFRRRTPQAVHLHWTACRSDQQVPPAEQSGCNDVHCWLLDWCPVHCSCYTSPPEPPVVNTRKHISASICNKSVFMTHDPGTKFWEVHFDASLWKRNLLQLHCLDPEFRATSSLDLPLQRVLTPSLG